MTLPDDYTNLTTKEVEEIASNSKYVKNYKYSVSYTGNPVDFEEYSLTSDDSQDENMPEDKRLNMASLQITGVSEQSDVIDDENTLYDGEFFTEEEINNGRLL